MKSLPKGDCKWCANTQKKRVRKFCRNRQKLRKFGTSVQPWYILQKPAKGRVKYRLNRSDEPRRPDGADGSGRGPQRARAKRRAPGVHRFGIESPKTRKNLERKGPGQDNIWKRCTALESRCTALESTGEKWGKKGLAKTTPKRKKTRKREAIKQRAASHLELR